MTAEQTLYEQLQNQNWLTRFLHSGRYAELLATVGRIERELGRPVRVLDIGCGPGATAKTLLEHFDADYTGIDNDPAFIAAAQAKTGSRPNCRFLSADAADPAGQILGGCVRRPSRPASPAPLAGSRRDCRGRRGSARRSGSR